MYVNLKITSVDISLDMYLKESEEVNIEKAHTSPKHNDYIILFFFTC